MQVPKLGQCTAGEEVESLERWPSKFSLQGSKHTQMHMMPEGREPNPKPVAHPVQSKAPGGHFLNPPFSFMSSGYYYPLAYYMQLSLTNLSIINWHVHSALLQNIVIMFRSLVGKTCFYPLY